MGRSRGLEEFRSICLVSGLRHRDLTHSLLWKRLLRLRGQRGLTAALTLIGAGTMGAILALRYASCPSGIISFPWPSRQVSSSRAKVVAPAVDELTVPGLRNMGNNCFLNVVLQALASSEVLVAFVKDYSHISGDPGSQQVISLPLANALSGLLNELSQLRTSHRVANPRDVMCALGYYVKKFDLSNQQDSAEALGHLACALQEERAKYIDLLMPNAHSFGRLLHDLGGATPSVSSLNRNELKSERALESWRQNLYWPMQGTLGSLLTCQQCEFQFSTDFQFFNEISLSPPQDGNGHILPGCTLEGCLTQFTSPEWMANVICSRCSHLASADLLTKMNLLPKVVWRTNWQHGVDEEQIEMIRECSCDDKCSCEAWTIGRNGTWKAVYAAATKRLLIGRAPEVLCLQIQRAVISQNGNLHKLIGHVMFPKTLDLFPYTMSAPDNVSQSSGKDDAFKSLMQMMEEKLQLSRTVSEKSPASVPLSADPFQEKRGTPNRTYAVATDEIVEHVTRSKILNGVSENSSSNCSPQHILDDNTPVELVMDSAECRLCSELGNPLEHGLLLVQDQRCQGRSTSLQSHASSPVVDVPGSDFTSMNLADKSEAMKCMSNFDGRWRSLTVSKKISYELLSVVVHHGGPHSGHYTVYRRARIPQHAYHEGVSKNVTKGDKPVQDPKVLHGRFVAPPNRSSNEGEAMVFVDTERLDDNEEVVHDGALSLSSEKSSPAFRLRLGGSKLSPDVNIAFSPDALEDVQGAQVIWFKVSDSDVKRVAENEVYMADASQLFYERVYR